MRTTNTTRGRGQGRATGAASNALNAPESLETSTTATLHEKMAQADFLLKGAADGVTVQDTSGRLLYVNDAAARNCGFADATTMLATPPHEIFARFEVLDEHGEVVAADRLPGRRVLAGETPEPMLLRVRQRATGAAWWSLLRAHAIHDDAGQPELAVCIWTDATFAHRQREAARFLADATARLGSSIDYAQTLPALANGLVPALADWITVDLVEDGARKILAVAHVDPAKVEKAHAYRTKYPPDKDAAAGVPNVLRTGLPELYRELPSEVLREAARSEEEWREIEALGLNSMMIVPILVAGKAEGALTLVSAESGRRYDEQDLELACELGRRAGVAIENARAHRATQLAVRARDEFLSVVGHELRTPLAALMLQIESLKVALGALSGPTERFGIRIDKTFGHALRIARLIDGLLDVSRIADGKLQLCVEDIDLAALVRETCDRFTEDAVHAGCALMVEAGGPCLGRCDPGRLEQVVSNLLSNAMKYGPGEPIVVRCETRGDDIVLSVRDEGIGIAESDRGRIFQRFERAVSERSYAGLGVGLWITHELVVAHGGSISVESELGRGSTFVVVLPNRR